MAERVNKFGIKQNFSSRRFRLRYSLMDGGGERKQVDKMCKKEIDICATYCRHIFNGIKVNCENFLSLWHSDGKRSIRLNFNHIFVVKCRCYSWLVSEENHPVDPIRMRVCVFLLDVAQFVGQSSMIIMEFSAKSFIRSTHKSIISF